MAVPVVLRESSASSRVVDKSSERIVSNASVVVVESDLAPRSEGKIPGFAGIGLMMALEASEDLLSPHCSFAERTLGGRM